ncbi:TIGR04438 family Trp-rich protein [Aquabacterium sp. J223]|uniref:TIGR04438 family Trp-rich protein n=1 Tax=Aquabacterium sp. J223 TaxID=2898431 RepID=UPI0021AD9BF8|nr:TIGR04438 family Trp-rich protein [Aquabacterium sp. J223]UUX96927.1 TIGR04438 family Trp-rich protein [Aquabacterium sp. J223]
MAFLLVGVLLVLLKLGELGPTAAWSWWAVLSPFGLALLWWWWSDSSGRTQRRAMEKFDAKREERRRKHLENMGLGDFNKKKR